MTGLRIGRLLADDGRVGAGSSVVLPVDFVTSTAAILAIRRAGKSNAAAVIVEQLYDHDLPFVVVDPKGDWWGLRSSRDGQSDGLRIPVLGGLHGDVPLEPGAGDVVAEFVAKQNVSLVLDVSELSKAAQIKFLQAFFHTLLRVNRDPRHLVLEECDEYVPQRFDSGQAGLVAAVQRIVKRGGFRGLGMSLISQRSAAVNKDVLTQCETLVAMRVTSPLDRHAVRDWIDHLAAPREIVDQLPTLEDGEAFVSSPHWLPSHGGAALMRLQFDQRATFDSGATPQVGKSRPAARMADIELPALQSAMAATIEQAKANDPAELRRRIAALERQLAERPAAAAPERIEVPVLSAEDLRELRACTDDWAKTLGSAVDTLSTYGRQFLDLRATLAQLAGGGAPVAQHIVIQQPGGAPVSVPVGSIEVRGDTTLRRRARQQRDPDAAPTTRPAPAPESSNGHVPTAPQQRVLDAIAWWEAVGCRTPTRLQVGFVSGYDFGGGYGRALAGALSTGGLIHYPVPGQMALTEGGRALAQVSEVPPSDAALHSMVMEKLTGPQAAVLEVLIRRFPDAMHRGELAAACGYDAAGGYWRAIIGKLSTLGLVEKAGSGEVRATDLLFVPTGRAAAR